MFRKAASRLVRKAAFDSVRKAASDSAHKAASDSDRTEKHKRFIIIILEENTSRYCNSTMFFLYSITEIPMSFE